MKDRLWETTAYFLCGKARKEIIVRKEKLKKIIALIMVFAGGLGIIKIVKEIIGEKRGCAESGSGYMGTFGGETVYAKTCKPLLDTFLSFAALIVLSPLFVLLSIAVSLDDPGPVFFTQERIGRGKERFRLHKFRSMKMSTPHDVPTHQLADPEQYITRVGKFLRKYSLDELPQIWDIFVGNMSIIGPRPALWNQDDLIAERDKYGANDVKPGLTGWAQINGRDELEIADKAKLDGEYVRQLRNGGMRALFFDLRCLTGTVFSVLGSRGVVEGGTGELKRKEKKSESGEAENRVTPEEAGFEDYGHRKHFNIDTSEKNKKRVLITGAGSYIGESFENWTKEHYPVNFAIDTLDMQDLSWREADFSSYDAVFHVAGIAHADIGKVSEEEKKKYYAVNTDLAIETARKAKAEGVRQFVFMSSMIIYGDSAPYGKEKVIDEHTLPAPANFYGDSKWQADKGVRALADESFRVAVLRPPMIYGKGSKGNYRTLEKLAKKLPVFPDVENRRSMLYIDNLCEFLCKLMLSGEGGVYFPQNGEYTKTSEMVREIAEAAGKRIRLTKLLKPAVAAGSHVPGKISGLVDKAFGNSVYDQRLSKYEGLEYQHIDLKTSIAYSLKVGAGLQSKKKRVLVLVNHDVVIYNFRLELVERLLDEGYEVHISSPIGEHTQELIALGIHFHEINIDRHGMNPITDFLVLKEYNRLIKEVNPVIILGYTIKPNIYGAIVARQARIPFVANITGLGIAVENGGLRQKVTVVLYKFAFTEVQRVFFQNEENKKFFIEAGIAVNKYALLPGSGVNLVRFPVLPYPSCGNGIEGEPIRFAFISRIMKEKGIEQFLDAAEEIKAGYPATEFHICGFCESEYEGRLEELEADGTVIYHGMIKEVSLFLKDIHCVVHPTYYPEGLSNVLLEACSSGRPIITTDRSGCREVIEDSVNGYMVPMKDEKNLIAAIKKFIALSPESKEQMGIVGRKIVEKKFSREIVVNAYMNEVQKAGNTGKK